MKLFSLSNLTTFIMLSYLAAGLAQFIQMCMGKGMIFHTYKAWITYWFKFKPRKKYNPKQPERWYAWFFKPLGGCIYCFSVWLSTAAFIAGAYFMQAPAGLSLLAWPFFIGSMYVFLETIENKIK